MQAVHVRTDGFSAVRMMEADAVLQTMSVGVAALLQSAVLRTRRSSSRVVPER
jgi:hypothetical protein